VVTRERLIFTDGDFAAGTSCELAPPAEAAELLSGRAPLTRAAAKDGELLVIALGGGLRLVRADEVQLVAAASSEAA
jgi:hypothetical protein